MVIDDVLWERLQKLLPKPKGRHGKNDRLFMEAICWMLLNNFLHYSFSPGMGRRCPQGGRGDVESKL